MNADAFNTAVDSFQGLAYIADWVQALSNLISLVPNFVHALGF